MKKYHTIFILFFFAGSIWGQGTNTESKPFEKSLKKWQRKMIDNSIDCNRSIEKAMKDFQQGEGKYFIIGDLTDWDIIFSSLIENKLDIKTEAVGCIPLQQDECYNLYADYYLKTVHGKDIFKKLTAETDALYKKTKQD